MRKLWVLLIPALLEAKTVVVTVTNGTDPSRPTDGLSVILYGLDTQGQIQLRDSSVTRGGRAIFTVQDTGLLYAAEVRYQGVQYFSSLMHPGETPGADLMIPVSVYETTHDPENLRIRNYHLAILLSEELVMLQEIANVENTGDRTYLGIGALGFPLAPEALGGFRPLLPASPQDWLQVGDTAYPRMTAIPGQTQFALASQTPLKEFEIVRKPALEVDTFIVFTDPGIRIKGDGVIPSGHLEVQGRQFNQYTVKVPPSGEAVRFTVIAPKTSAAGNWAPYAGVAGGVLAVLLFLRLRRRREEGEEEENT